MSLVTALATLAVVAFLLWLSVAAWRARRRPTPPPAVGSTIGLLPDPPNVDGPGGT